MPAQKKKLPKKCKINKKKYPFVRVEWVDINSDSGWDDIETILSDEPADCISHGWLLLKNDEKVIIASSNADDGDFGDRTVFPASVVKKIEQTNLKEPVC